MALQTAGAQDFTLQFFSRFQFFRVAHDGLSKRGILVVYNISLWPRQYFKKNKNFNKLDSIVSGLSPTRKIER